MDKDKVIFSTKNKCKNKQIFVDDNICLSVVESQTTLIDDVQFNDVLCVTGIFYNLLSIFLITNSSESKTIIDTPNHVGIKDAKDIKHVLPK